MASAAWRPSRGLRARSSQSTAPTATIGLTPLPLAKAATRLGLAPSTPAARLRAPRLPRSRLDPPSATHAAFRPFSHDPRTPFQFPRLAGHHRTGLHLHNGRCRADRLIARLVNRKLREI